MKRKLANKVPLPVLQLLQVLLFCLNKLSFPDRGWGNSLEKMPLSNKAKANRSIANSGKLLGSSHHSAPTSWKKGKTFLEDEYL